MQTNNKTKNDIVDAVFVDVSDISQETLATVNASGALAKPRHAWLPKLPHFQDESQKKALGNILKFMALVLVFTLVARGATGVTLAKVETITPYPSEIVESVSATGTVQAASSHSVTVPAGLTLTEVLVVPGQNVSVGDEIARLDTNEVAENRQRAQLALDEMNLNLEKLERGQPYDSSALTSAQNALTWAEQDYANTKAAGDAAIAAAQTALTNAQNTLNALQQSAAAAQQAASAPPPTDASGDISDTGASPPASGASAADIAAAEAAVATAQTALDNAMRDADTALQGAGRSIETARLGLTSAQQADATARQGVADTAAQNALDADALRLDIENQQTIMDSYDAIQNGTITAETDGTVMEVMSVGTMTGENALALISSASGGYTVSCELPKIDADKLKIGAQVEVSATQGMGDTRNSGTGTVVSISTSLAAAAPTGEEYVSVTVRLTSGEWTHGQSVNLEAEISRQQYYACVPLSALRQGQNGYFVYVMEESSGVLGTENVARQAPVTLLAQSATVAAIEGNISGGQRVIGWASKPLADGDTIRVRQP